MKIQAEFLLFTIVVLLDNTRCLLAANRTHEQDLSITTKDLVKRHGYDVEYHNVTTQDGYILRLDRVLPANASDMNEISKPVVLLVHGLLGSSDNWVINYKGLAFMLIDLGYDVWLGNCRGNRYSRKHLRLSPDVDKKFWDFSWHEMGVYDLPAMIDYILDKTGQIDLFYVGHSQGTTVSYVMASERPEYNSKIRLLMSLAPVAFASNSEHILFKINANNYPMLEDLVVTMNLYEIVPNNEMLLTAGKFFCKNRVVLREICGNALFMLTGYDTSQLNMTDVPFISATVPAGASAKQFLHYAQEIVSGEFRQYDYGKHKNLKKYHTEEPPTYRFEKMTLPVALFYAKNDWMASANDVEKLSTKLPNVSLKYIVPYTNFNHLDFIWAIDAPKLLYNRMFEEMEKYLN